ncbi:MAG TPA: NAD-dependent epimerase/dehydratase family protein [Draconibacterium sp.]|nr:NAD-dependent epimerase/dehydratase family protein [Draconibacterium sp.]
MQVILGAGGSIGTELAKALKGYTKHIRLMARNPQKVNTDDELFKGDVTNANDVDKAIEGMKVAYLTVGLPYNKKVWQNNWPVIVQNVIKSCKKHGTKLVFFDNVYMYDADEIGKMTEESKINPPSKKGKVRAALAQMILDETKSGELKALIARAADFYGPGIKNGIFNETIVKNLKAGKKANWFCGTQFKHNLTYTPDAAKATALLGNTDSAYGQVWHLPSSEAWTGEQWINATAKELGVKSKVQVAPKWLIKIMGIFIPIMGELHEMLYQYNRDYVFDSSKFEAQFKLSATSNKEALRQIVKHS